MLVSYFGQCYFGYLAKPEPPVLGQKGVVVESSP